MSEALRAEWTKLRTVPSTGGLLIGAVMVTVAVSVAAPRPRTSHRAAARTPPGSPSSASTSVRQSWPSSPCSPFPRNTAPA